MLSFQRILKGLIHRNTPAAEVQEPRTKPSWQEIVEIMYDKGLSFCDEIVSVTYSENKENRVVITKSKGGYYKYVIEQIMEYDDSEWFYVSRFPDCLPGEWISLGNSGFSFFGTEEEAWNEIRNDPYFKLYFEKDVNKV